MSREHDTIEVTILNWKKYNPRKDIKQSVWFRMEDTLFDNPEMVSFTGPELLVWIYLLCLASKKTGRCIGVPQVSEGCSSGVQGSLALCQTIVVHVLHAQRVGRLRKDYLISALEKLKNINVITYKYVTSTLRPRYVHVTSALRTRALRDETRRDETNETNYIGPSTDGPVQNQEVELLDFDLIYQNYPKRKGHQRKADGIKLCISKFKTKEAYENLKKAVVNYSAHCTAENKIGTEFVTQFKTFIGAVWEEWVNPQPVLLTGNGQHPNTHAQKISQRNDEIIARRLAKAQEGAIDGPAN